MNLILIIFLIIYIVGIIAISLRLHDIIKNPDKYEDLELEARAADKVTNTKYCKFFKSLSHQYACILFIPSFILFGLLSYLALRLIHKIMAGESELIMLGGTIAGLVPALFLGIFLIFTIAYFIKTPFFAIAIDGAWCSGGRARNIKVSFICLLVSFVLLFPFYSLSANCYVHFDDEGIHSSTYFELGETYTPYEDVLHAKVWMLHKDNGTPDAVKYQVTLPNGVAFDIAGVNTKVTDETLKFHKLLEENGTCEIEVEPITDEDMEYLKEHASPEKLEIIKYIFEGFH